jgi:hypothetical protein
MLKIIIILLSVLAFIFAADFALNGMLLPRFNSSSKSSFTTLKSPSPKPLKPTDEKTKAKIAELQCKIINNTEDMDCSDFEDQDEAQDFYSKTLSCTGSDRFNLDKDNDGIACEPYYPTN